MRNEGDRVLDAIDEAVRIGREAHIPVEICTSRLPATQLGTHAARIVAKVNAARAAGVDISADT